jgi:hypothetical protein
MVQAVEYVLNSCTGLRDVLVFTERAPLLPVHILAPHKETLTSLTLWTEKYSIYTPDDLAILFDNCENIAQLALDLPEVLIADAKTWEQDWTLRDTQQVRNLPLQGALVRVSKRDSDVLREPQHTNTQ